MLRNASKLLLLIIAALCIYGAVNAERLCKKYIYPVQYTEYVEKYSSEFGIDKYFIYAIIKTESNFDSSAESEVGARGLMQIMDVTYDYARTQMEDSSESYDDMFNAKNNIYYGTFIISRLYKEYGSRETALAAYFSGRGCVNEWLENKEYSDDGRTLKTIPSAAANHYVSKVMTAYNGYTNLYNN